MIAVEIRGAILSERGKPVRAFLFRGVRVQFIRMIS